MTEFSLPTREWIVIFYPQTGATRLCPSIDFAENTVSSRASFATHAYKSPKDFQTRHDHLTLEKFWSAAYKNAKWSLPKTAIGKLDDYPETPPDLTTEVFAKQLWELLQDIGERMRVARLDTFSNKTKENYELLLGEMKKLIDDEVAFEEKYNNQARIVFTALFDNGKQFLNEEEIKQVIYAIVANRTLKTKQKPWVVFQYYRPQFIKDGYVVRGRKPKETRKT